MPPMIGRAEFFRKLGIGPAAFHNLRNQGLLPEPQRVPGSTTLIYWSEDYLRECRKIIEELKRVDEIKMHLDRKKLLKMVREGKL